MPTQITLNQLLIIGAIIGVVFGLIPLILGFKRNKPKIGILGFILTAIAGTMFSMLGALPICGLFTWLVLRKPSKTVQAEAINEDEAEVAIENS